MPTPFYNSRLEARDSLLTQLGLLAGPIRQAILAVDTEPERIPFVRAQFRLDHDAFIQNLWTFGTVGAYRFETECMAARNVVWHLNDILDVLQRGHRRGEEIPQLEETLVNAQRAIRRIPLDDPSIVLPPASPFTAYLRIRAHCAAAVDRLDLLDPYLDDAPFHRYLSAVGHQVSVTVLTSAAIMTPSGSSASARARRDRIISVSELFATEHHRTYRFLVADRFHDRHLRSDTALFHLGGSFRDAAGVTPYTFAPMDGPHPTELDSLISGAEEWFGPTVQTHRRQ